MTYFDARAAGRDYLRRVVRDADGNIIPFVIWCNTATGELERYAASATDPPKTTPDKIREHRPAPLTVRDE